MNDVSCNVPYWRGHQTSPTAVSWKGRLPQKLQSKFTFSCEIVQIHCLFRHGFIKKSKSKFNRNRKNRHILFLCDGFRKKKNRSWYWFDCKCFSRVDTKHKIIFDFFFINFLFHHSSFRKMEGRGGGLFLLTLKDSLNYPLPLFKEWFHLWPFYSV